MASVLASNKFGLESVNQSADILNEILHSPNSWLGFDHARLADGYIKGDLKIFILFKFAGKEWLADFQGCPEIGDGKPGENKIIETPSGRDFYTADVDKGCKQTMVLVGNVQFVEYPEIVSLPSLVRFGVSDSILRGIPHSLYLSSKRGFVDFISPEDGKHGMPCYLIPLVFDKLASMVI